MFLLSYKEATTYYTSNEARMAKGSDYAKSQGLHVSTERSYQGNGYWWLRSPTYDYAYMAYSVYCTGSIDITRVESIAIGVRPACWINL